VSEQQLRSAEQAIDEGDAQRAREILEAVIENDQRNVAAWLLMHRAVDDAGEKQICLENVLTLDPGNAEAQAAFERLRGEAAFFAADDPFAAAEEDFDAAFGDGEYFDEDDAGDEYEPAPAESAAASSGGLASNRRLMFTLIALLGVSSVCMLLVALLLFTGAI
jgi:hypothetical protein